MHDPARDARRLELEKKLSAALLKLGRLNRDLLRDRIFRDKERLVKERSDINMLLLLYDAQRRESGSFLPEREIKELLEARGGATDLDDREAARLRARRTEIGTMLREVDHLPAGFRELPQGRLKELLAEKEQLKARVIEVFEDPVYFDHRVRKMRKAVATGKREKTARFLRGLTEQIGPTAVGDALAALTKLADPSDEPAPLADLVGLVTRSASGPFLQAVLADVAALRQGYPDGWRSVVAAALGNVALFRGVAYADRSSFWQGAELGTDLSLQRLAAQNPSSPPEILTTLLGCPVEELERCRARALETYGSDATLHCLAEILRDAGDPELISRILDVVDDDPVVRYRFYYVAHRHAGLPAALARRILTQGDLSVEDAMDFVARNPDLRRSA